MDRRKVLTAILTVLTMVGMLLLVATPAVVSDPNLEERVNLLEEKVAYLETFHPPMTIPPQALVFDVDTTLTAPLILRPGDTVELRNGAQLRFGPGSYLDAEGTPTSTWSDLGDTQNLVRDINVFGSGDLMFMAGSLPSMIRYVNFDLQPLFELDHYPLHWHHAGDSVRGTVVEGVVVQNSTNRCVVPHASNGITFTDLICKNITETAIWWNQGVDNASHDIAFNHVLVDGVSIGAKKYRTYGFEAAAGTGLSIVDSVIMNVAGSGQSGGMFWGGSLNSVTAEWKVERDTIRNSGLCLYYWTNSTSTHTTISDLTCLGTAAVTHGAYRNTTAYVDIETPKFKLKAVNGSITGGHIGELDVAQQIQPGTYVLTDVQIDRWKIDNGGGTAVLDITATNVGLSCADLELVSVSPGLSITIDGASCDLRN